MSLLSLAFTSPWILLALAGAPALYWLLRVTPPPPRQIAFPPLRLILGERRDDATPARTPLWLLILRMVLAALVILAMAGPTLVPSGAARGKGPLLLLIDNVWTAAPDWAARQAAALSLLEEAARAGRPAAVLGLAEKPLIALEDPGAALGRLRALAPRPFLPPRAPALPAIESFLGAHEGADVVWLSDGQQNDDGRAFAEKLAALAPGAALLLGDRPPRALTGVRNEADALAVDAVRAAGGAPGGKIRAFDSHGAALGDADLRFTAEDRATARLILPLQLRNDVARLALLGEDSTGGVFLLDSGARRRRVGLVGGAKADQPLLSPLYYLRKSLAPHADLREEKPGEPDPIGRLIGEGADVLILADMVLAPDAREKLDKFLKGGGTVVRFAGPRLASAPDDLLPVKLRRGGRTLGGALSWERPKTLAPFDEGSPFSGLIPPAEANVSRQILAEPEPGLPQKTWARLSDGTPLVTAQARGAGTLILFHIAAETSWSNLPLSGLFVDMLRKILDRAGSLSKTPAMEAGEGLLPALQSLDGFGALGPPAPEARALPSKGSVTPDAEHPPGYYGAPEAPRALNAFASGQAFKPLDVSGLGFHAQGLAAPRAVDLRGPLLLLAALLALGDAFAALWLGGDWRRRGAPAMLPVLAMVLALLNAPNARAQDKSYQPALTTSLAYVATGDSHSDRISAQGLTSLSATLSQRTSFNPGAPRAVDPARDELAFYPMIYWPVSPDAPQPGAQVAQRIAAYMKQGGLVLFDTRDASQQGEGGENTPAQDWLKLFLQKLDPPPLAQAPKNHVIFRTFYLLEGLAGRAENGPVYIEALPPETEGEKAPARAGDGVSPLIIASTDLAAGWASDQWGEALYPSGTDSIRQHELALRGGVNIVMYTLTGNYKADQVHVPELLERLGMNQYGLSFAPLVPLWALALFALVALALTGALLARRRRGAVWRGFALAALLAALSGPSLVEEKRDPLRDVVALVVDRTASQKFDERTAQTENAQKAFQAAAEKLGGVDVRVIEAGDAPDGGEGTRLFTALDNGLADLPAERLAGIVMLTDGIVHDIPPSPRFKAPLHVLVTGHEGERDRRIALTEAPRYGLIGKDVTFTVKVSEDNGPGEPVTVTVKRDGALATRVLARPGREVKIPVKLDHGGANVLEFDAEALPGELTAINNKAVAVVEGVRDHLKVLLVSGEPNPGERAWRNLLKADANVDLVHFTILRPPEKIDGTPVRELALIAFPTAELFGQKINEFDLILFDRYSNMGLLPPIYFENIVNYVRRGGAFAIVAGPNFSRGDGLFYTPIGRLTPARPTGEIVEAPFRAALSEIGGRHPVTRALPGAAQKPPAWSEWFRQEQAEILRGAAVLTGAGDAPLLVLSREGKGRVALLLSDQLWLWARGFQGGGPYEELMRRMAHWLMKEPDLEEEVLRGKVAGPDLVIERQTLAAQSGPVHVTAPSGKESDLPLEPAEPGLFRAKIAHAELGLYRLSQGQLTALVPVGPENPLEYRELVSTTEKLRPLAEATGGSVRRIGAAGTADVKLPRLVTLGDSPSYAGADFIALRRTGTSVARGISLTPLAAGLAGLLILLSLIVGGWAWEGQSWRGRKQ